MPFILVECSLVSLRGSNRISQIADRPPICPGAFLVRAAWEQWERRPEGPAYLLSTVVLLYLADQCAFFSTTSPPFRSLALGRFSRVPADGFFLQFLNFEIQDLSPLQAPQPGGRI